MRISLPFILLATCSALGYEIIVSNAKRTEMSAAVFSGTVTNIHHLPLVVASAVPGGPECDRGWWRAEVVVETISKQDVPLGMVAVVYYPQQRHGEGGDYESGFSRLE